MSEPTEREWLEGLRPEDEMEFYLSSEVCSKCGNRPDGKPPNVCSPMRCDAWEFTAQFDHETREWVHPKMWERLQMVRSDARRTEEAG